MLFACSVFKMHSDKTSDFFLTTKAKISCTLPTFYVIIVKEFEVFLSTCWTIDCVSLL